MYYLATGRILLSGNEVLSFATNDKEICHNYTIEQDEDCELGEDEISLKFRLSLSSFIGLTIDEMKSEATVIIDDSREPKCSKPSSFLL